MSPDDENSIFQWDPDVKLLKFRVFEENPKFFCKKFSTDWEDHILLAFILYEYQKG